MNDSLQSPTILVLNKNWQAVASTSPVEVFGAMLNDQVSGLQIQTSDWMIPLSWKDWQKLPIRDGDRSLGTPSGRVRIPTVVILSDYSRLPRRRLKFGLRGLWERDGGRCQYTGRHLTLAEANIDHVIPSSRGGPTSWENCVLSDRKINNRKADQTPDEAGLTLLKEPARPPRRPVSDFIKNKYHIADWDFFLPAS